MDTAPVRFFPAIFAVAAVLGIEMTARQFPGHPLAVTGAARICQTAAIFMIFRVWNKGPAVFGLVRGRIFQGMYKGFVWSLGFAAAAAIAGLGLYLAGLDPVSLLKMRLPGSVGQLALFYLVAGVVGPVAEEVFFRGVIYGYFRDLLYPVSKSAAVLLAVLATTSLFVAAHSHLSVIPVPQIVGGIIFCLAYEAEKNLMVPVIIHSLGNMALFTLSLF